MEESNIALLITYPYLHRQIKYTSTSFVGNLEIETGHGIKPKLVEPPSLSNSFLIQFVIVPTAIQGRLLYQRRTKTNVIPHPSDRILLFHVHNGWVIHFYSPDSLNTYYKDVT